MTSVPLSVSALTRGNFGETREDNWPPQGVGFWGIVAGLMPIVCMWDMGLLGECPPMGDLSKGS